MSNNICKCGDICVYTYIYRPAITICRILGIFCLFVCLFSETESYFCSPECSGTYCIGLVGLKLTEIYLSSGF